MKVKNDTMDNINKIIAANITALRTAAGMTQLELAERLHYSDKLVSKWERGDAAPNAQTLKQLSEIFSVSVDYLFCEHSASKAPIPTEKSATPPVRKSIIAAISIIGIWLVALLILFTVFWSTGHIFGAVFIYAIPVSLITLLVLNSVWNGGKKNYFIIAALVCSIFVAVYFALFKYNCWQIFLLLPPSELIVCLCAKIKRR